MNLNLMILGCFLFKTVRSPIPSCSQHDERAVTQTACVPCGVADLGVSPAFSRNDSALGSCCASLLRVGAKCLRLCFELRQYTGLLGSEMGRGRPPRLARLKSNYAKSSHCW